MLWISKCRRYRGELALLAGGDLARPREVEVLRHVTICPECRRHWQTAQDGQKLLEQLRSMPVVREVEAGSLWPQLRNRMLAMHQRAEQSADWRGWLPVGALAAACLTTLLIMTDAAPPGQMETGWANPILDVQPVARPLWPATPVGLVPGSERAGSFTSEEPGGRRAVAPREGGPSPRLPPEFPLLRGY